MEVKMSTTDVSSATATDTSDAGAADMKLEVVVLPVSDVDRAKSFYHESLGWRLDAELTADDGLRVVRGTDHTPNSQASVNFGTRIASAAPGSADLVLAVHDIETAREELVDRGVEVSGVFYESAVSSVTPGRKDA
jgi:catechol 2,3-dioxygenase-like lactoylglutathione lyase family enzyme